MHHRHCSWFGYSLFPLLAQLVLLVQEIQVDLAVLLYLGTLFHPAKNNMMTLDIHAIKCMVSKDHM